MKVKANGISFHCRVDGRDGAPWLVFSNSLATNLSMWDEQTELLRDHFHILRYDHRGHGGTDAPEGAYTFDLLIGDAVALFDAFEIKRSHFVGLSMGGMTAVGLAEKHPERLNRVVACDCGPASTPQSAQQWAERIALARANGMEALVEQTVQRWCPAEFIAANPGVADRLREMIRTTPLNGFVGCALALSDFDLRPGLGAIKSEMLFMCGTKDASLPGTKTLNAGVPGSKLVEIPGAGHISNVENPALFNHALKDFLTD